MCSLSRAKLSSAKKKAHLLTDASRFFRRRSHVLAQQLAFLSNLNLHVHASLKHGKNA